MDKVCFAKLSKPLILLGAILIAGLVIVGCGPTPQDTKTSENEPKSTESPAVTVKPVSIPEGQATQEAAAPSVTVTPAETAAPPAAPPAAPEPAAAPAETPAPAPAAPEPVAAQPAAAAPAQTPELPVAAPATPEATPEQKAAQDAGAELIALFKSVDESRAAKTKISDAEKTEIENKWKALLEKCGPPLKLNDEASLVAASFKGPEREGGQPYFLSLLFKVTKSIKKDYVLTVEGVVDPSHVNELVPSDRAHGYAGWSLDPKPPTSQWKTKSRTIGGDSYILMVKEALAAPIPYQIRVSFNAGPDGNWARVGDVAVLPWMVAE